VRSEKGPKSTLELRLLLGFDAPDKSYVQMSFGIGENATRVWTRLDDPDKPPQPPKRVSIPIGCLFPFCDPFGMPQVHLFGLVMLRCQAVAARSGLWHLKPGLREQVPRDWASILSYGRSGFVDLAPEEA
jgi:hypothetical protein